MKATRKLHDLRQSLWLDNITRDLLNSGTLRRYISELAITGLTSKVSPQLRNRFGIAVAKRTYKAYRDLLASPRWRKLAAAGARPQRMLWASTGSKDPEAPDTLYAEALAAPDTINTMPDKTLLAFADHGEIKEVMPHDGGDAEEVLAAFGRAGIDDMALAARLQVEGARAFAKSWKALMDRIGAKRDALEQVARA